MRHLVTNVNGKWLGRNKGRVVNKLKLHGEKDNHSLQLVWWLDAA
jgi:hypothetical protein